MEQKNPFEGIKTCESYTRVWALTLLVFLLQGLAMVLTYSAAHFFGFQARGLEVFLPSLIVTVYVCWAVLTGLGVSWRAALADWNAGAVKDLLKALKYFWGYAGIIAALFLVFGASYYFWGDDFARFTKPLSDSGGSTEAAAKSAASGQLRLFLMFFSACVAAPVAEELFFRRIMYTALRARNGFWASASVSGAVFALFHGWSAPVIFPVGVYFCWVYERERRLPVNIMLHGLVNLCVTLYKTFG